MQGSNSSINIYNKRQAESLSVYTKPQAEIKPLTGTGPKGSRRQTNTSQTMQIDHERSSQGSHLPVIPERGDPSTALVQNIKIGPMFEPDVRVPGSGKNLTATVTDIERANQVVQASPYSKAMVTGGQSLASIPSGSRNEFMLDRHLSVNEKLSLLDGQTINAYNVNS